MVCLVALKSKILPTFYLLEAVVGQKQVPQTLGRMFQHQNKGGSLVKYGKYLIWLKPWQ